MPRWSSFFGAKEESGKEKEHERSTSEDVEESLIRPPKWSLGVLNPKETDEVPGSVILLSTVQKRNEPLGLHLAPARTSSSSLPSPFPPGHRQESRRSHHSGAKKTPDGKFVLEPQPDDSHNDPLNWPLWRRNAALLSIGYYCMLGGGMTPILAAGFNNVAASYNVSVPQIALTTGLYMLGLGVGCVIMSPTAILYGKRPVYLITAILYILSSIWCALSPNYTSLVLARIFQGIAVSPVECLPSATVAEIFFLHERAYRLGIYTLLLLGGKNLVPLVSAVIIEALGWQWVFWIVAMAVGFAFVLLFFFVSESFWDRTPRPRNKSYHINIPHSFPQLMRRLSEFSASHGHHDGGHHEHHINREPSEPETPGPSGRKRVAFAQQEAVQKIPARTVQPPPSSHDENAPPPEENLTSSISKWKSPVDWDVQNKLAPTAAPMPDLHNMNSPWYQEQAEDTDYFAMSPQAESSAAPATGSNSVEDAPEILRPSLSLAIPATPSPVLKLPPKRRNTSEKLATMSDEDEKAPAPGPEVHEPEAHEPEARELEEHETPQELELGDQSTRTPTPVLPSDSSDGDVPKQPNKVKYTEYYRSAPPKTYLQTLQIFSGRLTHDKWIRVAARPFVLFLYPSVLWSAVVYSLSIGWLIVLSESISTIYKSRDTYNFTSLQAGLIYISPFIGGILGTAVAGKLSDIIVRFMARRNDGVYEPEFRLVMALPVAIATTIGLMGFGWSAEERDNWIVPTVFFGIVSFGCSLGSTTSITFAVDSYRQYAGEALVTLNFSKNIFHGLVFSLFFPHWLEADGSKRVFIALGAIQMACLLFTIPMFIYGKRARMWTVRKNLMEKL